MTKKEQTPQTNEELTTSPVEKKASTKKKKEASVAEDTTMMSNAVKGDEYSASSSDKDLSIEQKLSNLYQLQAMLSKIDEIKILRGELPLEVRDLEDEIAGLQTRIQNFQLDGKDIETKIGQQRMKITEANNLVEKYQQQLDNVRNNREFDSLSKEIEYQGLEVELAEKRIREFTQSAKVIAEDIEKSKSLLEERQIDLKAKKEELDEIVAETRIKEENLREEAKQMETTIDQRLLTAFKRIRKSARNGLAVVYIQRDACGGCFNKIPPQRQLDIKLRKKIIVCEHCGRIMIDPELAGIEENKD